MSWWLSWNVLAAPDRVLLTVVDLALSVEHERGLVREELEREMDQARDPELVAVLQYTWALLHRKAYGLYPRRCVRWPTVAFVMAAGSSL